MRRDMTAAITLALAPLWTGCLGYTVVGTKKGTREDIQRREVLRMPPRIDVSASSQESASVQLTAITRQLCRARVRGTATPYVDTQKERKNTRMSGLLFAVLGAGGLAAAKVFPGTDGATLGVIVGAIWLPFGLIQLIAPVKLDLRDYGSPSPFERVEGEPFPCEKTPASPTPNLAVLGRVSFGGSASASATTLDLRATTGPDGTATIDLEPAFLAAPYCGTPTLSALPSSGALPSGAVAGPPATLTLRIPPVQRLSLSELRRKAPEAGSIASRCCERTAAESSRATCEQSCAGGGAARTCESARQSCLVSDLGGPDRVRRVCDSMYAECLLASGTSANELGACMRECGTRRAAELCR